MSASDFFPGLFKPAPRSRTEQQEEIEGLLFNFRAEPDEAAELICSVLLRMLDDELVHEQYMRLKRVLDVYARRNTDPKEVDEGDAHHEREARLG